MEILDIDLKKVFLVTGGAGFIGSNICEMLLNMGYKVRCLDNLSTGNIDNIKLFFKNGNFEFIQGDIRNAMDCQKAMSGIHYVLHQAALGSVPRSFKEPLLYCDNNINGFLNILEAARNARVKRVIFASSSSVYGDSKTLPKKEGEEGCVMSPYALTKEDNEKWAQIYVKYYGLETIGLRYFNVFGRRQNPNGLYAAVIPAFIQSVKKGIQPHIYGDGNQSRDFTYIDNVLKANYLACCVSESAVGKSYNIASGERQFLNDVYWLIGKAYNFNSSPIYMDERVGDIRDSFADISLAKKLLGYDPEWTFEEGLNETIKWYNTYGGFANENAISN